MYLPAVHFKRQTTQWLLRYSGTEHVRKTNRQISCYFKEIFFIYIYTILTFSLGGVNLEYQQPNVIRKRVTGIFLSTSLKSSSVTIKAQK